MYTMFGFWAANELTVAESTVNRKQVNRIMARVSPLDFSTSAIPIKRHIDEVSLINNTTLKANITIADSSPFIVGNIIDAVSNGMVDRTVGIAIVSFGAISGIVVTISDNIDDPANGLYFGGDGITSSTGVDASGFIDLRFGNNRLDGGTGGSDSHGVNFIGQGYVAGAMAAVYDQPAGSYTVFETQSIVSGADVSRFSLVRA